MHLEENSRIVKQCIALLRANFKVQALSMREVAGEIGISPLKLREVLWQELGCHFRDLLNDVRIMEALALMEEEPEIGRVKVAARCGFTEEHYFSRVFKRVKGRTFEEVREEIRERRDDRDRDIRCLAILTPLGGDLQLVEEEEA